jgi:hypothetical protein
VVTKDLTYNQLLFCFFFFKMAIEILGRVVCADFTVGKWMLRVRGEITNFENGFANKNASFYINFENLGRLGGAT